MASTRSPRAPTNGWTRAPRPSPIAAPPTTTAQADGRPTNPAGIGLPGLRPASAGASCTSFNAPIDACRTVIETPSWSAAAGAAPATVATVDTTRPSRIDGKGWVSRTTAAIRARRPSDVDELVEVLDQVVDEPLPAVGGLGADARDQGVQRDGRHHLSTLGVAADHRRRSTAGSERPFDIGVRHPGCVAKIFEHAQHAAPLGDVAHHLLRPQVDLLVALLG